MNWPPRSLDPQEARLLRPVCSTALEYQPSRHPRRAVVDWWAQPTHPFQGLCFGCFVLVCLTFPTEVEVSSGPLGPDETSSMTATECAGIASPVRTTATVRPISSSVGHVLLEFFLGEEFGGGDVVVFLAADLFGAGFLGAAFVFGLAFERLSEKSYRHYGRGRDCAARPQSSRTMPYGLCDTTALKSKPCHNLSASDGFTPQAERFAHSPLRSWRFSGGAFL